MATTTRTDHDRHREDVRRLADETERDSRRHPAAWGFGLGALIAVATVIFFAQNTQSTAMEWLWFDFTIDLWIALAVAFVAGALTIPLIALGAFALRRRRRRMSDLAQRVRQDDDRRDGRDDAERGRVERVEDRPGTSGTATPSDRHTGGPADRHTDGPAQPGTTRTAEPAPPRAERDTRSRR